jgi:hypothetical protein
VKRFYVGCHQLSDVKRFESAFVSIARLSKARSIVGCRGWVLDSGAFMELKLHGKYRLSVAEYANAVRSWIGHGDLHAIVSQDYMCEPFILERTGLDVVRHQRLTIERYDELLPLIEGAYVMPVLQGYSPAEYARHVDAYADRLAPGAWVGIGSVCKRQGKISELVGVLDAVLNVRPDIRLHGFGVKLTALKSVEVRDRLHTADSMAWSYSARKQGRNGNDWREGEAFRVKIDKLMEP